MTAVPTIGPAWLRLGAAVILLQMPAFVLWPGGAGRDCGNYLTLLTKSSNSLISEGGRELGCRAVSGQSDDMMTAPQQVSRSKTAFGHLSKL